MGIPESCGGESNYGEKGHYTCHAGKGKPFSAATGAASQPKIQKGEDEEL
jgi:hypothetical protein